MVLRDKAKSKAGHDSGAGSRHARYDGKALKHPNQRGLAVGDRDHIRHGVCALAMKQFECKLGGYGPGVEVPRSRGRGLVRGGGEIFWHQAPASGGGPASGKSHS